MYASWLGLIPLSLVGLAACGGVVSTAGGGGAQDNSDAAPDAALGGGAIDSSGQPNTLVMSCAGAAGPVALSLPCHVGGASLYVTECDLAGPQDSAGRLPPISFSLPLTRLPAQLQTRLAIPFEDFPTPPEVGYGAIAAYPGEHFSGSLIGTVVFSQVDAVSRAFVGRLEQAHVDWKGDAGDSLACDVTDAAFWAVAGDFI
jgi:hypothetical protein